MSRLRPFSVSLEGRHLVEASAGTGKTYNITSLFIRCLVEKETEVDEILVVTYTKAATAELKERILRRIRESIAVLRHGAATGGDAFLEQLAGHVTDPEQAAAGLDRALRNFDEASIYTIHGFCQRALQEQAFMSGISYDFDLLTDDAEIVQEAVDDWWRKLVNRAGKSDESRHWLSILMDEGYRPDPLRRAVSKGVGKPYLHLAATPPIGNERDHELEELQRLFGEMKEMWSEQRPEIQRLLLSDAMSGSRYRTDWVESWSGQMDAWLDRHHAPVTCFDKLDRFSVEFIRSRGVKKGEEAPEHPFFHMAGAYLEQAGRVRSWLPVFKKELLEQIREAVRRRKLEAGELGYDDILVMLHEALQKEESGRVLAQNLRRSYPVALVDEFQDTDPVQYEIFRSIYGADDTGESTLFLIGDPKQSIYSFRGADVFSYLQAGSDVPPEHTYGLKRNFRSQPGLVEAVNTVFSRPDAPFLLEEIRFEPVEAAERKVPPLRFGDQRQPFLQFLESVGSDTDAESNKSETGERAAGLTAESISRLLNRGADGTATIGEEPVTAGDIAVLVRTHRQADLVREQLQKRRINSVEYSKSSVFETDEARNVELLLRAIAEPRNEQLIRSVLSTELFRFDARELLAMEDDDRQWSDLLGQFAEWNRLWREQGVTPMFRTFLRDVEVEQHLVSVPRGERKLANTLQLGELLQARENERQGGMFELVRWLARKRIEPDRESDSEQLRLESDEDLVRIVTMHRSKGLEYPVVYCPFLWDGFRFTDDGYPFLYHDREHGNRPSLDLNERDDSVRNRHRFWAAEEELSESLRLAYVAMTRAVQQCTIIFETASGMEFSPLGYLLLGEQIVGDLLDAKLSGEKAESVPPGNYGRELDELVAGHEALMLRQSLDEQSETDCKTGQIRPTPDRPNRAFTRKKDLYSNAVVSSFSSIVHPSLPDGSDEAAGDEFYLPEELSPAEGDGERTIFTFPRGPQAGTCIHTIFEELSFAGFTENADTVGMIEKNLEQFGFDTGWSGVLKENIDAVLQAELKPGMKLAGMDERQLLKEAEFYFDMPSFRRAELLGRIRGPDGPGTAETVPDGFMKGYIDLVFRHDEAYYILDYKSNHLGNQLEDYATDRLREEIILAGYDIQYHIYTVALHRMLGQRLPDYAYDTHFGGVYYLFVRGMGHGGNGNGIFMDRPGLERVEALDALFTRKENG